MTEKQVNYIEEKTIIQVGNSKAILFAPKLLNIIELKVGDKVKIHYDFIKKEIIIVGVNDGKL